MKITHSSKVTLLVTLAILTFSNEVRTAESELNKLERIRQIVGGGQDAL